MWLNEMIRNTCLVGINISSSPPVKNYVWRVYSGLNGVRPEPWELLDGRRTVQLQEVLGKQNGSKIACGELNKLNKRVGT